MKKLPIDLPLRSVSTKVSLEAWDRAQALKTKLNCRLSDVVSAALLYIDEAELKKILDAQAAAIDQLPKSVKGLMRNLDQLSPADRELLRNILK